MQGFKIGNAADTFMIIGIVVVAFIVIYSSGLIKKNCDSDVTCFKQALNECKSAKLVTEKNNNVYSYIIAPSFSKDCVISIKLEKATAGSSSDFRRLVEGKSMKCSIPKDKINDKFLDDFSGVIDTCTGPLKEGLYELIIQRMYTLVVKEIAGVLEQTKTSVLKGY